MTISNKPQETHVDVVDVHFRLQGEHIDADHGYALYAAISRVLEKPGDQWLHVADDWGLLPVRGRYIGGGKLVLGRTARFGLRLPAGKIPKILPLAGKRLDINGDRFMVGTSATAALKPVAVLYTHVVTTKNGEDEARFDAEIARQLESLEIRGKAIRGPRRIITIKDKKVVGFSLLVSELNAEESIRLQERGLGGRRKMGCGVFLAASRERSGQP
jgi:CRISPR-associated protein Cas6